MPLDNQAPWMMIFLTLFMYLTSELVDCKILPLYQQPYTAAPSITYETLIQNSQRFRNWTNFEFDVFYEYLCKPLSKYIDRSRTYFQDKQLVGDGNDCIDPRTKRGCVLNVPTRIIRYLTILKNESMSRIEQLFDQDRTTAMKDFIHINLAVQHCFSNKYLRELEPGSDEFENLRGAGCFKNFSNAVGAIDITKIKHRAPRAMGNAEKTAHFDGHNHEYNSGFGLIVDGYGLSRNIIGRDKGGCNDILIWQNSHYMDDIESRLGNAKLLADGIFRHVDGPFICSFPDPTNERELMFNVMHILARTMVEHVFGRQKGYWPIIAGVYSFHLRWLPLIYRNVALLTNMLVIHQSPMRKQ